MDDRQQRTLKSFHSVLGFVEQHRFDPEPPLLVSMCRSLEASIRRIRTFEHEQIRAKVDLNTSLDLRRRKLRRERMMPLVRIAKPLLAFAPKVESALRVPHARADAYTVATAALRMADVLQPHAKLLASAGFDKRVLQEFRQESRTLALSAKTAQKARDQRGRSTAAIAAEFKKAMQTVTVIEGLVMLQFATEPEIMKHWRNRRRVSARLGRPRHSKRAPAASTESAPALELRA